MEIEPSMLAIGEVTVFTPSPGRAVGGQDLGGGVGGRERDTEGKGTEERRGEGGKK